MCHHLDWQTALEERGAVEIVDLRLLGRDQGVVEPPVFLGGHRTIQVVPLPVIATRRSVDLLGPSQAPVPAGRAKDARLID